MWMTAIWYYIFRWRIGTIGDVKNTWCREAAVGYEKRYGLR